jgi:hypothetical protein
MNLFTGKNAKITQISTKDFFNGPDGELFCNKLYQWYKYWSLLFSCVRSIRNLLPIFSPAYAGTFYIRIHLANKYQRSLLCFSTIVWEFGMNCRNQVCQITFRSNNGSFRP